jgi:hypothetical protein
MSTLHVLMPAPAGADVPPDFRRWLARGDRLPAMPAGHEAAVRGFFRFAGEAMPTAALRHHCHSGEAAKGAWLCADPAYVRGEANGARLLACPVADLSVEEAGTLASTLRPLFGDAGMPLEVDTAREWCVRLADGAPAATLMSPARALGVDLIDCLPGGDGGRIWRKMFNEVQVALHAHPVNRARVAAGKWPVNAVWFWGRGALPGSVETTVRMLASADDALGGLARVAGVERVDAVPSAIGAGERGGDVLLDLDRADGADPLSGWFPEFRRWLRERRFDAVELAFASGERFRVRQAHRLRFWRRP